MDDTVFALASGLMKAGVAVVRVSGPLAHDVLLKLAGSLPLARQAAVALLKDPTTGEILDRALVIRFSAPASFTGEDVVELHLHGGRAVISGVLGVLTELPGLRPAEAGEFTRRAFLNGKIDLAEAEALADLIDAETATQKRQALRGLDGGIGERSRRWRADLIDALALTEAQIDFMDEDDVPKDLLEPIRDILRSVTNDIRITLDDRNRGERLRHGLTVVVAGPPNVGKSSLINRIARRSVAIVSPHAGTTRDAIEVPLDLNGYPVVMVDTAGLRDSENPIEQEGIRIARQQLDSADLIVWMNAADVAFEDPPSGNDTRVLRVLGKSDIDSDQEHKSDICISTVTDEGIDQLLALLAEEAKEQLSGSQDSLITRERHRSALEATLTPLMNTLDSVDLELVAEDIRIASRELGRIAGHVHNEDVLDAVFSRFCIGK